MARYKDAQQPSQDIPYSSRRVYLPVQAENNVEVLVHSKAAYHRDPVTGALRRIGKVKGGKKHGR